VPSLAGSNSLRATWLWRWRHHNSL